MLATDLSGHVMETRLTKFTVNQRCPDLGLFLEMVPKRRQDFPTWTKGYCISARACYPRIERRFGMMLNQTTMMD